MLERFKFKLTVCAKFSKISFCTPNIAFIPIFKLKSESSVKNDKDRL